jgi:hypothetical protein
MAALEERNAKVREVAVADFPLAQDLDELELADLYSLEVAQIVTDDRVVWLSRVRDMDIELLTNDRYLVSFAGPWEASCQYFIFLSASEKQVEQLLGKSREDRGSVSYLVAFRVNTVAKPRLEVGSEVTDYDDVGALTEVMFQEASARILGGDLLKVYEY